MGRRRHRARARASPGFHHRGPASLPPRPCAQGVHFIVDLAAFVEAGPSGPELLVVLLAFGCYAFALLLSWAWLGKVYTGLKEGVTALLSQRKASRAVRPELSVATSASGRTSAPDLAPVSLPTTPASMRAYEVPQMQSIVDVKAKALSS